MKHRILTILGVAFLTISCKAQYIIPVENVVNYRNTGKGLLGDRNAVHVKDVNNKLLKFVGTWKGTYNNQNFEIKIVKHTDIREKVTEEMLLLRFKIIDSNGEIIEDNTTLPNNNYYVSKGAYMDRDEGYVFDYIGRKSRCGQNGYIFTQVYGANDNKLQLFLAIKGEIYPDCKTGAANQVLPTKSMELIKQ